MNIRVLPLVAFGAAVGTLLSGGVVDQFRAGNLSGGFAQMGQNLGSQAATVIGFPLAVGLLSSVMRGVTNPGVKLGSVRVRLF